MNNTVTDKLFGVMPDGQKIYSHTIVNGDIEVSITDFGARITSLVFNGVSCVCGFDTLEGYLADNEYHGAIIGRYANRISQGRFTLNGKEYKLAKNERGVTHLHGGDAGFSARIWTLTEKSASSITMSYTSPDGEEGYPSKLSVAVTYTLESNALIINYRATSDGDTVINLTNHSYFNVGGVGQENVRDQILTVNASAYCEVDSDLITTGRLIATAGTPFDFSKPKRIGDDIDADDAQLKLGGGYDHCFVLDGEKAATITSEKSGVTMDIYTTEGGIQIYTANGMTQNNPFSGGVIQTKNGAVALECNRMPDSPNRPEFPSCILRRGETYSQTTTYAFSAK